MNIDTSKDKSILIIEDERPLLSVVKGKFEINNFDVVTARSVAQALSYLENGVEVDVIWLDHYLFGKENGLDFVTKIKAENSTWKNVPIFVVSNTVTPDKVASYIYLGITKYYTKVDHPLNEIIDEVKKFVITNNIN